MNTCTEWWKYPLPSSAVLTMEVLQRAFNKMREIVDDDGYVSPRFYLDPKTAHLYRCLLVREYWKKEYREFRMFRTACEKGWLNARL